MPRGEEVGELIAGQGLSGLEQLVTKLAFREPMSDPRHTPRKASLMVVTTREQADENQSASGELDGRVCEDVGQGVDRGVVAIHAAVCVLRGVLAIA